MKKRLLALALCAAMIVSAAFTGCQGGGTTESSNSTTTVSTASSTSSSSTEGIPENGGFKTISYEASKDKYLYTLSVILMAMV